MNLILFEPDEIGRPLARTDARALHVVDVLRRQSGEPFDAGIVNGPRGKARVTAATDASLTIEFEPRSDPPPIPPLTLLVGLPRPQTARDILRDATTIGVAAIHFVRTDKGEPNYAQSTLWKSGEWRRLVRQGAEQAFCTRLPEVTYGGTLPDRIRLLPPGGTRLALDNYEAARPLSVAGSAEPPATLCVGPERGWSATERDVLRLEGFTLVHLGARVLRTETACVAALTLMRAQLGLQ